MRRLLLAGLLALGCWSPASATEILSLQTPGAFEIRAGAQPVSLAGHAQVEKQTPSGWVPVGNPILLLEQCPSAEPPACVTVAPDKPLRPVAWTGYSCSGQCNSSCKKNVYFGPGNYRLAALSCDRSEKLYSPVFHLPRAPRG